MHRDSRGATENGYHGMDHYEEKEFHNSKTHSE
jgi:hypothetical protein